MASPVAVCVYCQKEKQGYFQITRFDTKGVDRGTVNICSLLCLLNWSYALSIRRGGQVLSSVRDTVRQIVASIRG